MIALELYLLLGAVLFTLGAIGAVAARTAVAALVATLLAQSGAAVTMVAAARAYGQADGVAAAVFIALIATAEIAVAGAILREPGAQAEAVDADAIVEAE